MTRMTRMTRITKFARIIRFWVSGLFGPLPSLPLPPRDESFFFFSLQMGIRSHHMLLASEDKHYKNPSSKEQRYVLILRSEPRGNTTFVTQENAVSMVMAL